MNDTPTNLDQAIQALKDQRPREAADLLKDYIWRDPSDGTAYAFLGVALSELGDSSSALEALERAHYLAPADAGILYNYGLVLEAAGRPKEARIRFSAALQLDPGYHRAQQRLLQLGGPFPPMPPGAVQAGRTETASSPPSLLAGAPNGSDAAPDRRGAEGKPSREVSVQASRSESISPATPAPSPTEGAVTPSSEAAHPARKWVRERPAEKAAENGTVTEAEPAGTVGPSPMHVPPPIIHSPTPTPPSATETMDASSTPGGPQPATWPPVFPSAPSGAPSPLLARGAELLQNRTVLAGLCVLFTAGGLVIGIAIRGAMPGPVPRMADPLQAAGLRRGSLAGQSLAGLDLTNAVLEGEKMPSVRAEKVILAGARLQGADLHESKFSGANLGRADLVKADLRRADLGGAHLDEAQLTGVFMRGAYLKAASLRGANLQQAYLSSANLVRADLTGATLTDADLRGANLTEAVLVDAILSNAQLQGANLTRARLGRAVLKDARYDAKTRWPAGFNPKLRGAVSVSPLPPAAASTAVRAEGAP